MIKPETLTSILVGIMTGIAIVGLITLINISNSVKPLGKLGEDDLKETVNKIDDIYNTLVAGPPSYSPEKEIPLTKAELIEEKQFVSIPPGDYRVLKISVVSGEGLAIESQLQSPGTIKFHLVNSKGDIRGFVLGHQYKPSLLCAGSKETYYFFLNNSSDPINPKSVWIQLVPREKVNQK